MSATKRVASALIMVLWAKQDCPTIVGLTGHKQGYCIQTSVL